MSDTLPVKDHLAMAMWHVIVASLLGDCGLQLDAQVSRPTLISITKWEPPPLRNDLIDEIRRQIHEEDG